MLLETYRHGKISVPVAPIYTISVMRVTERTVIPPNSALVRRTASEPVICPMYIEAGEIVVIRYGKYAVYPSIEAALSGYRHAVRGYGGFAGGELAELQTMGAQAREFISEITAEGSLERQEQEVVGSTLAGLGYSLAGDSNRHKAAARRGLIAAASAVDSLGRLNPNRQRLLLSWAATRLHRRVAQAIKIRRSLTPWLAALGAYYHDCVIILREIRGSLGHLLSLPGWEAEGGTSDASLDSERAQLLCGYLISRACSLNVQPFLACRRFTVDDLVAARKALKKGMFPQAKQSLVRAWYGVRVCLAHVRLENIRVELDLLGREYRERRRVRDLLSGRIMAERGRLIRFIANLKELKDDDLKVRALDEVRRLVRSVIASIAKNGYYSASAAARLKEAVALL